MYFVVIYLHDQLELSKYWALLSRITIKLALWWGCSTRGIISSFVALSKVLSFMEMSLKLFSDNQVMWLDNMQTDNQVHTNKQNSELTPLFQFHWKGYLESTKVNNLFLKLIFYFCCSWWIYCFLTHKLPFHSWSLFCKLFPTVVSNLSKQNKELLIAKLGKMYTSTRSDSHNL